MFKRVLVPLDGSLLAEAALPTAVQLAREVVLLQAPVQQDVFMTAAGGGDVPFILASTADEYQHEAEVYVQDVAKRWAWPNVTLTTHVQIGDPAHVIVETAAAQGIDLIVMSTHGRTGLQRWMLGSVTERVLHHAPCPVLALRRNQPLSNVLVPLDGSAFSEQALGAAVQLVRTNGGQITLLRIQPPVTTHYEEELALHMRLEYGMEKSAEDALLMCVDEYLASVREEGQLVNIPIQVVSRIGQPAEEILNYANQHQTELIVMSTHGRTGLQRWMYGSVAEKVLHGSQCAMLLVRPQEATE